MDQKKIRTLKNISTGMVVLAVVFAFLIAGVRLFGVQVFGVLTGSMEPTYPTGSLIYVKPVDARDLRVNDVITFSISPNVIATHRIVEIVPDEQNPSVVRYRTKGDANNDVDASLVSANNIIGKALFAVPQMGYIASYIQEPPGIYVAILVCGLMIALVFYTDSLENKQNQAAQNPQSAGKPAFDPVALINQAAQKLLGKPLIKQKDPEAEQPLWQSYTPSQNPVQPASGYPQQMSQMQQVQQMQQMNRAYPQQQPYYGQQQMYPQNYAQGQQQYVQQQPAAQQYYAPYPQQSMPQSHQVNRPQAYGYGQNQAWVGQQQAYPPQNGQYVQQANPYGAPAQNQSQQQSYGQYPSYPYSAAPGQQPQPQPQQPQRMRRSDRNPYQG